MAGRFLSLFKVFRGRKKKDPGAAPAQQPEESEQFQTLQEDAALEKTQEQEPGRGGRFRKTLKRFRKFLRIRRRRKTRTKAAEGTAQPDSGLTELQAEPDVSPDSVEWSQDSDAAMNEDRAKADKAVTEDVPMTGETQGIANTDTTPYSSECSQDSDAAMNEDGTKADKAVIEDVPITGETQAIANTDTKPYSAECSQDSDAAMNEDGTKVDKEVTEDVAITNTDNEETEDISNTGTMPNPTLTQEVIQDFFKDPCVSPQQQVPAIVRSIHQSLQSHVTVEAWLKIGIVRLAEEHPADVVLTLLRCAPTCDRAAAMMWRTIGSSGPAVEKVLPTLICVMEDWPLHSACTSDGDDRDVFALTATLVIWVIVQVPECHEAMILYSARLFVALLFHVVITTEELPPEEFDNFWRACQEEHHLPSNYNRFAVQAMKALLCRLWCDHVVVAMQRKGGWETLLCADTQHYAVGLLAREMRNVVVPFCSRIAFHLLQPLSREEPWDLPFLAFLVEVLDILDFTKYGNRILNVMSRHLQMECRARRRLALRGLVVLSKDPSMARRMGCLSPSLLDLLGDADGEVLSMSLSVFTNVLQHKDIFVSSTTAPKLAEALLLLFDHDNSHVQVLSLELFFRVMDLVVDEGKKPLEKILSQSLIPLFLHCHDKNWDVAKASRETLIRVAKFLKRRKLEQMLKKGQLSKFTEVLLAEDRSRAAEHLRRALPYLESAQEPLREAAIRFMEMAGFPMMKEQQEELQDLSQGLESQKNNASPSCSNIESHAELGLRPEEIGSFSASSEPVSQEQRQETLTRTPSLMATAAAGTVDDWYS